MSDQAGKQATGTSLVADLQVDDIRNGSQDQEEHNDDQDTHAALAVSPAASAV
jgi:hypothetical protein